MSKIKYWKKPTFDFRTFMGIALGVAYCNEQPRDKYKNSSEWISVIILCFQFSCSWGIEYSPRRPKQTKSKNKATK